MEPDRWLEITSCFSWYQYKVTSCQISNAGGGDGAALTIVVQLEAFAGVLGVADELQPHKAGGAVQGRVQQLCAREGAQQAGPVTAAIIHLAHR